MAQRTSPLGLAGRPLAGSALRCALWAPVPRCRSCRPASTGPPVKEGEVLEMRMETLTSSGQALGRIGPTRWVVMIFGALPRELVQLRIVRNYRSRSEARLCRILEASPERAAPRCPLFMQCSGCQYQHLSYESQLYWKREHVKQALSRIAGIAADVAPTVPSPLQYHYRTKLTPHAQEPPPGRQRRARGGEDDIDYSAIGFLEQEWGSTRDASGRRWRKVVDVPSCPIATEALNQALPAERAKACTGGQPKGKLLLRDTAVDGVAGSRELWSDRRNRLRRVQA
ncbi:unnamed protein product [Symbiodinium sp. CCMP2592]|nr:unnamed protein product [Symbiodinium sp. CCMP2592]